MGRVQVEESSAGAGGSVLGAGPCARVSGAGFHFLLAQNVASALPHVPLGWGDVFPTSCPPPHLSYWSRSLPPPHIALLYWGGVAKCRQSHRGRGHPPRVRPGTEGWKGPSSYPLPPRGDFQCTP